MTHPAPFSSPQLQSVSSPRPDTTAATLRMDGERLFLLLLRRMVMFGINDATCASVLITAGGTAWRKPLMMMRALVMEVARHSHRKISINPPCAIRTSRDEQAMLRILTVGKADPARSHRDTAVLLGRVDSLSPLGCFYAVADAFSDIGLPLGDARVH